MHSQATTNRISAVLHKGLWTTGYLPMSPRAPLSLTVTLPNEHWIEMLGATERSY